MTRIKVWTAAQCRASGTMSVKNFVKLMFLMFYDMLTINKVYLILSYLILVTHARAGDPVTRSSFSLFMGISLYMGIIPINKYTILNRSKTCIFCWFLEYKSKPQRVTVIYIMSNDDLLKSEWSHISQNVQRLSNHQFGSCRGFFCSLFCEKECDLISTLGLFILFKSIPNDRECHKSDFNFFFFKNWMTYLAS